MKTLVTGGAGFIGSHLCQGLVDRGCQVRVLDSLISGHRENLAEFDVDLQIGDLRDSDRLEAALADVEVVFHHAAIASVRVSVEKPLEEQEVNVVGTLRLLEAARHAGVRRVIFAASAAAYGLNPEMPKAETMIPTPSSPYGLSKVTGEHYCRVWSKVYGLETVALRYFNIFGPRQDPQSPYSGVISIFARAMLDGSTPVIYGDGEQSRDFTFVSDAVRANLCALDADAADGGVYNVGTGRAMTVNELVAQLNAVLGTDITPRHADPVPSDVRVSVADISRIRAELGFEPRVSFADGLQQTVDWMRTEAA